MSRGLLLVVSGPSGAGKGTIVRKVKEDCANINYSISATTRSPRACEKDGVEYFFLSREDFLQRLKKHEFLEWAEVYGNYYGTPRNVVLNKLGLGQDIVLEIDINGALQVKHNYPEAILIFVVPPSFQRLKKQLEQRGTDSQEVIAKRLECVRDELGYMDQYDYVVINDKLEEAVAQVKAIIAAEHSRSDLVSSKLDFFSADIR